MTKLVQVHPDVFVRAKSDEPSTDMTLITLRLTDCDVAAALESGGRTLLPDLMLALRTALVCAEGPPVN